MPSTTLAKRLSSATKNARRSARKFVKELKELSVPRAGDIIRLDRKGMEHVQVDLVETVDADHGLFAVIATDGYGYIIAKSQGATPWKLAALA